MTRIFSHKQPGMTRLLLSATFALLLGTLGIVIAQDSPIRREKGSASSAELQRSKSATQEEKRREKEPPKPELRPKSGAELQQKEPIKPPPKLVPGTPPQRESPPLRRPGLQPRSPERQPPPRLQPHPVPQLQPQPVPQLQPQPVPQLQPQPVPQLQPRPKPQPHPQPQPQPPAKNLPGLGQEPPTIELPPTQLQDTGTGEVSESLRIATFNTRLTSPVFNTEAFDSAQTAIDTGKVADRILDLASQDGVDIIALNEVWDEHSKKMLVEKLSPVFPYYIKKMDDGNDVFGTDLSVPKLEDSGLMLFSRFPMESFRVGAPVQPRMSAFRCFSESSGIDQMAAKGVGVVVIRNPSSHRLYVVAFTHLQDGDKSDRASQMKEIEQVIRQVRQLNPETTRGEVFVMGDLNIAGCSPSDEKPLQYDPTEPNEQEWRKFFWTKGSYFTMPLYDAWAWTTSAFDRGFTSPGGGSRLDYIIHEFEPGHEAYVVQHIHHTLSMTNSDHTAVLADLNRPAPFCNPRLARRPSAEPQFANESWDWVEPGKPPQIAFHGKLRYPGSMQWYRFDGPGTYSFAIPYDLYNEGLRLTLYQKDDLTTPIDVYKEEMSVQLMGTDPPVPFMVGKYHIPTAPFFVRVSNPQNRAWHGDYSMAVHRHKGTSMEDAIILFPGEAALDPHPPTTQPLNPEDQIWFELYTDEALSGEAQDLEFFVQDNPTGMPLELRLLDSTGQNEIAKESGLQPAFKRQEKKGDKWYLTLERKNYSQSGMTVGWTTNLTWLVGLRLPGAWPFKLVCGDETSSDWLGSDEIDFYVDVDGAAYFSTHFGDFDSDEHRDLEGLLPPVAFIKSLRLRISENDSFDDKVWNENTVWALDPKVPNGLRRGAALLPADGNYEFRYNLTHGLNAKQP